MAKIRSKLDSPNHWQKEPRQKDQGKRPQGVSKSKAQRHTRSITRLSPGPSDHSRQQYPQPTKKSLQTTNRSIPPQPRSGKRSRESEDLSASIVIEPSAKRSRASAGSAAGSVAYRELQSESTEIAMDPIDHWRMRQSWPEEYFEPDTISDMLSGRMSTPSLLRKRSDSGSLAASSTTASDQKPREEKSVPYRDIGYETLLETKGSFMTEDRQGPKKENKDFCRALLAEDQEVPSISPFSENVFRSTCQEIQNRVEPKVVQDIVQDITRLIVPSAEELADFGAKHLEHLVEAVNKGWNNSVPLTGIRPQPDYSVGFKRTAFTEDQLKKLAPFVGDFIAGEQSFFMATYYMYFPFLTCEVNCGTETLDIADRQNAHSMTLAVRAIVELFQLAKREEEVHREILAFSVSHDQSTVRIYGHYPVIDGKDTRYYRYSIHKFDFTALDGKEKWTAYKFIKNIYDTWMPAHFKRLCSVINDLPLELDFDVAPLSQDPELLQDFESSLTILRGIGISDER